MIIRALMIFILTFPFTTVCAFEGAGHHGQETAIKTGSNGSEKPAEKDKPIGDTPAVDLSEMQTLKEVIDAVAGKRIIYIGESHTSAAHHAVQLEVIRSLHREGKPVAIAMEMFQRPFQPVLDAYIGGTIDEREFLKRTEYFKRWVFDFTLYKPILDYARQERIPVIALNARREITEKVSRSGVESLSEEDKKEIPSQMDLSDEAYRNRLKDVFKMHSGSKNFEFFLQSQVLWDETMAESIDRYFSDNPDFRKDGTMIVIAGAGHLTYGSGIPKRAFRRNGLDYTIIVSDTTVDREIADYILFPKALEEPASPKLGVLLKEEGDRVVITGFPPESPSEKAGLAAGDVITALDGDAVEAVEDMRLHLFYRKKGDTVRVRVARKAILFGERELDIYVKL